MAPSLSKYIALAIICSFFLGAYTPVHAVQINKLYSASVPVASQQKQERLIGFNQALSIVLVKASGRYTHVSKPETIKDFLPAEPFVQTFSYRENPAYQTFMLNQSTLDNDVGSDQAEKTDSTDSPDSTVSPLPYLLEVSFAQSVVEEKMAERGLPVWGSVRPSVLVWVAHEQKGDRSIVGTSDETAFVENLRRLGEQRGVPIYLPVADLQDVSTVNIDDLWGLFPGSVDQASERYQADAVVMMRVYQSNNGLWSGNWSLSLKQASVSGAKYDSELPRLLEAMVSALAAELSSHYAISMIPGEEGGVLNLEIDQINTFADYIDVQQYLAKLPPVTEVNVDWVRRGRAGYQVILVGSKKQFFEHVDLGGRLQKDLRAPLTPSEIVVDMEPEISQEDQTKTQTLLFNSPVIDQIVDPQDTEYYIWSSGNALSLDRVKKIDTK